MPGVLTDIAQLTPDWLTARLRANGFLSSGHVSHVRELKSFQTRSSSMWHLEVDYSPDSPLSAPRKLFLKVTSPKRIPANPREVEFYRRTAPAMLNPPVLRCYDAAHHSDPGIYHVLLEDVSDTHCVPEFPLPPTRVHAEMIVDALADLHAFWWDHPRLGRDIGEFPAHDDLRRFVRRAEEGFPRLANYLGDRLSPERKHQYEQAFARNADLLIARFEKGRNFTFIHGDAHCWNFLLPKYADRGKVRIIDWYTYSSIWRCWLGASDLASLIIRWWYPERRRLLEEPLLRRYHARLEEHGIKQYSWEDLLDDYRLAAISSLYVPINEVGRSGPKHWLPQFENAATAVQDLGPLG